MTREDQELAIGDQGMAIGDQGMAIVDRGSRWRVSDLLLDVVGYSSCVVTQRREKEWVPKC